MVNIEKLIFNNFQENTYLLYDETGDCVVVDPGCYGPDEEQLLSSVIRSHGLKPVRLLNTHCHVDHILGNNYVSKTYGLTPEIHKEGLPFLKNAHEHARIYGFVMDPLTEPVHFLTDGEKIGFGRSELEVLYTPGHADGSVCFVCKSDKFVISGDVLFRDSIGRTDLPTGDFEALMESIHQKLFVLDDVYAVYCGHGPETTIGYEKANNPFIR